MINPCIITAYADAVNYNDMDTFLSNYALSSMWGEGADLTETANLCRTLWEIHEGGIRRIINYSGVSGRKFAQNYGIPYRTIQNWMTAARIPPAYLLILLASDQGMI